MDIFVGFYLISLYLSYLALLFSEQEHQKTITKSVTYANILGLKFILLYFMEFFK